MEQAMIKHRHHFYAKRLKKHLNRLEQLNAAEERKVIAEVAKIKRNHIKKFGRPKPITTMPLHGVASEDDSE